MGELIDLDECASALVDAGYERVEQVEERGQFALRGGILDIFGATEERAVRVDTFDVEIESLRWFSTFTQRSLGEVSEVELAPAAELAVEHRELAEIAAATGAFPGGRAGESDRVDIAELLPLERFGALLDLLGERTEIVLAAEEELEPALGDHWSDVSAAFGDEDAGHLYVAPGADPRGALPAHPDLAVGAVPGQQIELRAQAADSAARSLAEAEPELERLVRSGYSTVVAFPRRGEGERAAYNLARLKADWVEDRPASNGSAAAAAPRGELSFAAASLREGFIAPSLKLAVYPEQRLLRRRRAERPAPGGAPDAAPCARSPSCARATSSSTRTTASPASPALRPARWRTSRATTCTSNTRATTASSSPPTSSPRSPATSAPAAPTLRSASWAGAAGTRSRRVPGGPPRSWPGSCSSCTPSAASAAATPSDPTATGNGSSRSASRSPRRPTSARRSSSSRADMESERPMDRLVCGDVGYGKTEVALRAAFKAAAEGKQVLMLVPTTILAQQHYGTFKERLADYPFTLDHVSRFRTQAEQKEAVQGFAEGRVDILIGTHRVLSRDVRAKELGLLVIDEEQRFGVKQKELLRQLKLKVDVISMSATPIPRTLQMSLAGLRDISVIETPPEGRRPVRTFVGEYEEELVKNAIEREHGRGGQAFFLHNRVESIEQTAERLRALCPGVRFAVAHGQMGEGELEEVMMDYLRGGADVLVCTSIIESGIDIPQANTLIVEHADAFGLAQLYQIRGRVGRSRERAYAYLLYDSAAALAPEAAQRLAALSDYTELGAGFKIAMRDLEIRGAGNLLGDEQSGHLAALGFELYMQMIDEAVRAAEPELDGEEPRDPVRLDVNVDAYIPADYVPYEQAKIEIHRRIAGAFEIAELEELREELADRFGEPPAPVENLLALQRARIKFGQAGAQTVSFRGERLAVVPIELDSRRARRLREELPGASYESGRSQVSVRVPRDAEERFPTVVRAADALLAIMREAA